jgi:hypothetical protein
VRERNTQREIETQRERENYDTSFVSVLDTSEGEKHTEKERE